MMKIPLIHTESSFASNTNEMISRTPTDRELFILDIMLLYAANGYPESAHHKEIQLFTEYNDRELLKV